MSSRKKHQGAMLPQDPPTTSFMTLVPSDPASDPNRTQSSASKRARHQLTAPKTQGPAKMSSFNHTSPADRPPHPVNISPNKRAKQRKRKSSRKQPDESHQKLAAEEMLNATTHDPFEVFSDAGLKFPQIFGEMCRNIITEYMKASPSPPNAHFEYILFLDVIEKQFRKEYQHARFTTFDRFRTKFALDAATDAKVVMLHSGHSEPKFFRVNVEWDTAHLVPMRLFCKNGIQYVEVRVDAHWKRLPAFLDTLVRPQQPSYELMSDYWKEVQKHTRSGFKFMALPLELRRNVYRHAMLSNGWIVRPQFNHARSELTLPGVPNAPDWMQLHYNQNLLEASEQIRQEATEEYYRTVTFKFHDVADLDRFMKSKRPVMVTKIHLQFAMETHEFLVRDSQGYGTRFFKTPGVVKLQVLTIEIESVAALMTTEFASPGTNDDEEVAEQLKSEKEVQVEKKGKEDRKAHLFRAYIAMVAHMKNCKVRVVSPEAPTVNSAA